MSIQCPFTKQDCVFYGQRHHRNHQCGKSRDDVAVAFMQSMIIAGRADRNAKDWREKMAKEAYEMADIMLSARTPPEE